MAFSVCARPFQSAIVHTLRAPLFAVSSRATAVNFSVPYKLSSGSVRRLQVPYRHSCICMASSSSASDVAEKSIYDFTVKDIDGNDVSLSTFKGKVLLIVNVASRCGLTTSNYTELAELYSKFKNQGLEILAFPCNQFGAQEPGSNQQIKEFACSRFKAEYPIFDKIDVNGENTAPLYKFLKASKSTGLLGTLVRDNVKWNFEKFLVDKNGNVVGRYEPTTSPANLENDVKQYLEA